MSVEAGKKRCFVVMGFGTKTDLATGRLIDLDKSYKYLIKPVVEAKNIECVRADEILHSGTIDVPMYRELLMADLVIADISTANPNAIYELGIRHALRPQTTIVISENKLKYPFDLNHTLINSYNYIDGGIDYDEVMRFRKVLGDNIDAVLSEPKTDSPVYTFLNNLEPPILRQQVIVARQKLEMAAASSQALEATSRTAQASRAGALPLTPADGPSLSELIERGERAIAIDDFSLARQVFGQALGFFKDATGPRNPYLVQRLALATYKEKQPSTAAEIRALNEALKLLEPLKPAESNDPETIGLVGAIEKRLFEHNKKPKNLANAIKHYARGYYLRDDPYNGINLAYLLNVRADSGFDVSDTERIADLVSANRIRREVVELCKRELVSLNQRRLLPTGIEPEAGEQVKINREHRFWCLATKAEAHFGLGEAKHYVDTRRKTLAITPPPTKSMIETFDKQIDRLRPLLERQGQLLDPPWTMP